MYDALLSRIGLDRAPAAADADGLRVVHRAYLEHVPYEDLAVQLGETGPLDEAALTARLLSDGRGGYCFELNTVLAALLRACGFVVTHHLAVVGGEGPVNHMALLVHLQDERWLADAGLGEGFLEPLPFRAGRYVVGPFAYTLEREGAGTWWMGQHEWGSVNGFRMQEDASPVSAFEAHHRRLATDPESNFVKTLVVQKPAGRPDRHTARADALRGRAGSRLQAGGGRSRRVLSRPARCFRGHVRRRATVAPMGRGRRPARDLPGPRLMRVATHPGTFHADDVFAVAVLSLVHDDLEIVRTRDDARVAAADVRVDLGGRSDPSTGDFDHHQRGGAGERENGIWYASFGLVWREFGLSGRRRGRRGGDRSSGSSRASMPTTPARTSARR